MQEGFPTHLQRTTQLVAARHGAHQLLLRARERSLQRRVLHAQLRQRRVLLVAALLRCGSALCS
jgi:hypothetical protein